MFGRQKEKPRECQTQRIDLNRSSIVNVGSSGSIEDINSMLNNVDKIVANEERILRKDS